HLENLQSHIEVMIAPRNTIPGQADFPDHFMTDIQKASVQKQVLKIDYLNNHEEYSQREVEPIGLFYYSAAWHLIAWCRLRNGYRDFRADRISKLVNTQKTFESRNLLTLQEYFQTMFQGQGLIRADITFDKIALQGRPLYGSISQTDLGDKIRAEFMIENIHSTARWLLVFGNMITIHEPEELRNRLAEITEQLFHHYNQVKV
ncbi:MAG TPA: WYL domain-containing protein, partial [Flavitalea sp.]|nr:WYL domain-containing protein [Flavitalea sp.]